MAADRRDGTWVVEVVFGELLVQSSAIERVTDDDFVLVIAISQIVRV